MLEGLWLGIQGVIGLGLGASLWFCLASLGGARRAFASRPSQPSASEDATEEIGVTVLKPLKGQEADLYENLSSFCRQDYGRFQLVFGVADAADPAVLIVQRLRDHYPNVAIDLVVDERVYGTNYKVSNLENMYAAARYDLLVLADSDIRVGSGYLRRLVSDLRDSRVGLVTCLYRAVGTGNWPSRIEAMCVNTDFVPMVLVAGVVEELTYAFGATIALRRAVLEEIGGFRALTNYLADDYYMGNKVARRGYRVHLSDMVVETVLAPGSWRKLYAHQLRWARTQRNARPAGYFASIFTHGALWSLLFALSQGFSRLSLLVLAVMLGLRVASAHHLAARYLHLRMRWPDWLALPCKDLFASAVLLTAFFGNTVQWSGRAFRVHPHGDLELLDGPNRASHSTQPTGYSESPPGEVESRGAA